MEDIASVKRAHTPFRFHTSLALQEATGLRAATLPQLLHLLREVPESCIYYHTHDFLLSHHYLTPEPTNDFAYWVAEVLGEAPLGELLASIDILERASLQSLREALVETIETYLTGHPMAQMKFASDGQEFFFVRARHVILPAGHEVSTLPEFAQALSQVTIRSLYFHVFDARLRLGHATNDFSRWLKEQFGLAELAEEIARLDPYAHTLETLRSMMLSLVQQELARQQAPHAPAG